MLNGKSRTGTMYVETEKNFKIMYKGSILTFGQMGSMVFAAQ